MLRRACPQHRSQRGPGTSNLSGIIRHRATQELQLHLRRGAPRQRPCDILERTQVERRPSPKPGDELAIRRDDDVAEGGDDRTESILDHRAVDRPQQRTDDAGEHLDDPLRREGVCGGGGSVEAVVERRGWSTDRDRAGLEERDDAVGVRPFDILGLIEPVFDLEQHAAEVLEEVGRVDIALCPDLQGVAANAEVGRRQAARHQRLPEPGNELDAHRVGTTRRISAEPDTRPVRLDHCLHDDGHCQPPLVDAVAPPINAGCRHPQRRPAPAYRRHQIVDRRDVDVGAVLAGERCNAHVLSGRGRPDRNPATSLEQRPGCDGDRPAEISVERSLAEPGLHSGGLHLESFRGGREGRGEGIEPSRQPRSVDEASVRARRHCKGRRDPKSVRGEAVEARGLPADFEDAAAGAGERHDGGRLGHGQHHGATADAGSSRVREASSCPSHVRPCRATMMRSPPSSITSTSPNCPPPGNAPSL